MSLSSDMLAMLGGLQDKETVTYTPSGGSPRSITASILRSEPQSEFLGGQESSVIRFQVSVANDAEKGVNAPKVGKDTIALKINLSDASPTTCRVSRVISHDPGAFVLEVVK